MIAPDVGTVDGREHRLQGRGLDGRKSKVLNGLAGWFGWLRESESEARVSGPGLNCFRGVAQRW
jgi:hypothetical protein